MWGLNLTAGSNPALSACLLAVTIAVVGSVLPEAFTLRQRERKIKFPSGLTHAPPRPASAQALSSLFGMVGHRSADVCDVQVQDSTGEVPPVRRNHPEPRATFGNKDEDATHFNAPKKFRID